MDKIHADEKAMYEENKPEKLVPHELKATKTDEINVNQDQIEAETEELAGTDEKLAESKAGLEGTTNMLSADDEFFIMLKEMCSSTYAGLSLV